MGYAKGGKTDIILTRESFPPRGWESSCKGSAVIFINQQPSIDQNIFLNREVSEFEPSVIRQMTLRADEIPDAINLSQGMPDFDAPEFVKRAASEAIYAGHNQYAPPVGILELRQAVSAHSCSQLGFYPDPLEEVTIACGATESMFIALVNLTKPGDKVIIPSPTYENYWADCVLTKVVPEFIRLREPGWRLDLDELTALFAKEPRAIILCNPNNPTGTVYSRKELTAIAELCVRHNVVAITDEVYEHIVYDGREHLSIAAFPGMRERSVTISSASKTFSVTGWRIGTIVATPRISAARRRVHDFVTISAPRPFQHAIASAFPHAAASGYYSAFTLAYQNRRELLYNALREAGFMVNRPEGAYYLLADISASGENDTAFAMRMLKEAKVAAVPASCFFADKEVGRRYVRFCFCKTDALMQRAAEKLTRWQGAASRRVVD